MQVKRRTHRRSVGLAPVLLFWTVLTALGAADSAQATTLVRCKIDGKTVYSDTDCPRSTRLKNDLPASKPIRIGRKSKAAKRS